MTLRQTPDSNSIEPMAWLTGALRRVVSGQSEAYELHTLLPSSWAPLRELVVEPLAA